MLCNIRPGIIVGECDPFSGMTAARAYPFPALAATAWFAAHGCVIATPVNKLALERRYETFLSAELNRCTTCHLPSAIKNPENLRDFPHNLFGDRLRAVGEELEHAGKRKNMEVRLATVAQEDSDGDGIANESELLAGTNPGDAVQMPQVDDLAKLPARREAFRQLLASHRWQPFERAQRPPVPHVRNSDWVRTPVDAFIAAEHERRGLKPRPLASKAVLLRRVYLDLIGLTPSPDEQRAFAEDTASDAYEKVVDRLLNDPRHGERWGRHWMDVWRYSDWAGWTDGKQVRDSQRHIWRWRDWIVESLNNNKGYDRMVIEMLAADELSPGDEDALRATGFLVRNYKMLSREQWLEDTVKHTSQGFLGITVGCAKCHDHRVDPVSQADYYKMRAIFEPHEVRIDRVPGELDIEKNGLPRVYDVEKDSPTYFLIRGDERKPDKDRLMAPGVPPGLCGDQLKPALDISPVKLPRETAHPDHRAFVVKELAAASEQTVSTAKAALDRARAEAGAEKAAGEELSFQAATARHAALLAEFRAEKLEEEKTRASDEWKAAAQEVCGKQRVAAVLEARLAVHKAGSVKAGAQRQADEAAKPAPDDRAAAQKAAAEKAGKELEAANKKLSEAEKSLVKAEADAATAVTAEYRPRSTNDFPAVSTGRRLAFARWVASPDNPLTARVAMNHIWLRHFGAGIVVTPENFGANGARPSHPALLDWLAAEFMAGGWKMKPMHRMLVTSTAYRMASTPDEENARIDPDNVFLWRMPSRRMEAELVRDNILYVSRSLDPTMGGPDIDHLQGLTSRRRSIYLRSAPEKEVEFLKLFDGPSVNECYQRRPSVMPQQALALANSGLPITQAKILAKQLSDGAGADDDLFVQQAFGRMLARPPTTEEAQDCREFLSHRSQPADGVSTTVTAPPAEQPAAARAMKARENLILVLFNHHDFVTIR